MGEHFWGELPFLCWNKTNGLYAMFFFSFGH